MAEGGIAKHRKAVVAIGLLASAAFMYLAVRRLDLASLKTVWEGAHVLPWVPLGILSYVCGHVVRGQRCRLLVRREANLRLMTASNIVVVGYASNNVFPARLGELVRAGMLAERTGIPVAQSLMVTFIERVLDGLAILLLLVLGTMNKNVPDWTHDLVRVAMLVFGGACAVMLLGAHSPGLVVSGASRLGNRLGEKWHDRLVGLATSITNAGACLRSPRDALLLASYSVVVWCLEAGLFIAIMPAFGLKASLAAGAVAMSVTNLGLLVPSSPGFVGPFHFFCSRALMTTGIDEPTALAYAAVVHLAFYVPVTIWGAGAMLWYGVEVGATAAMARAARAPAKTTTRAGVTMHELAALGAEPKEERASAFTVAMVEAVVTSDGQRADAKALADTSQFVHGQLEALPPQLKLMFECGMSFFRFVTRLRYLRGYCDLSLETRRAWVKAWSESRYALFRKLMKPVKGIALLAYHDHPELRGALLGENVVPVTKVARVAKAKAEEATAEAEAKAAP
ncbi:MAG: flippase-like domain-containing protein [Labilithrix sp.]|nr:flippase-like domain-containing protein [Labilithrix sp.]